MKKLQVFWSNACAHAAAHREAYHHCLHASHVTYLGMVVFHGPYTLAASLCMLTLVIGYAFRLEIPDAKAVTEPSYDKVPRKADAFSSAPPRLG